MRHAEPSLRKGVLLASTCALLWTSSPLFIMYISYHADTHTQNALRYLSAGLPLLATAFFLFPAELRASLRAWHHLLVPVVFLVTYQTFYTAGISMILPTTASLVGECTVLWTILVSAAFFADERRYIKRPLYLAGTVMAFVGVAGVILARNGLDRRPSLGILFIILSGLCWSLYTAFVQRWLKEHHPLVLTPLIFTASAVVFLVFALAWGNLPALQAAKPPVFLALFFSGLLCVGITHSLYYAAMRHAGMALASNITLVTPFLTSIASYFLFDDRIALGQLLFGILLVAGLYVSSLSKWGAGKSHLSKRDHLAG